MLVLSADRFFRQNHAQLRYCLLTRQTKSSHRLRFVCSAFAVQELTDIQNLLDDFAGDAIRISAQYLLQLVSGGGQTCTTLFAVKHYATFAVHYLALLDNGHPVCDCMMGTNLGIPCRHFYTVLRRSQAHFHLGLFNKRYVVLVQVSCICDC